MRLGRTLDPVLGIIVAVGNEADDLVGAFGRAANDARNEIDRLSNLKLMHTNSSHCARMFRHERGRVFCSPASSPRRKPPDAICERNACTLKTCTLKICALKICVPKTGMSAICCIPMTPGIRTTDGAADDP